VKLFELSIMIPLVPPASGADDEGVLADVNNKGFVTS
jgi:hypothetical protein